MSVFISHAHADNDDADRIHKALKEAGVESWVDHHHLKPGDNFIASIQAATNTHPNCVFVLSPNSAENPNTTAEYMRYLQKPGGRLYVVLTSSVPFENFPWRLTTVQYVDLTKDFDTAMENLITAIKGEHPIHAEAQSTMQGLHLSRSFPYYHLDIPISGRKADLQKVRELLTENHRLIVLKAFGGTGKTRLAAELAITAQDFKDGVVWQSIESTTKADSLTYLLRDHLDLLPETELEDVWNTLADKKVLIILDNAESCTDRAAYAQRLERLPTGGGTRVLMTSRERWVETRLFSRIEELVAPNLEAAVQIVKDMAERQGFSKKLEGHEREFAEAARQHPRLIQYAVAWLQDFSLSRVLEMLYKLAGSDADELLNDILYKTLDQIKTQPGGEQAIADLHKLLV
jgi:hypothetical protein